MGAQLRLARDDDLDEVGRLTVAAYVADGLLAADDPYTAHLADARSRAAEAELWVAEDGPRVLGSVTYCLPGTPWAELSSDGEGEFRMLTVAPDARRRGIARVLVQRCLDRSTALGHRAVVLSSLPAMTAAHRLYASLGFVRTPQRDWTPSPGVDLWAFRLDLTGGG